MFAYCGNNPVARRDESGGFWGAVIGGAVAGALINTVSYLVTSGGDIDGKDLASAAFTGMITGAIGGIGGIVEGAAVVSAIAVGVISGCVTALNTDGSLTTKIVAGATAGVVTGVGTYFGTKVPVATDNLFVEAVTTYAGSLLVGANTEVVNVASQSIAVPYAETAATYTPAKVDAHITAVGGGARNTYNAYI